MPVDYVDETIAALVRARENGLTLAECLALVRDTFAAPWSHDPQPHHWTGARAEAVTRIVKAAAEAGDEDARAVQA